MAASTLPVCGVPAAGRSKTILLELCARAVPSFTTAPEARSLVKNSRRCIRDILTEPRTSQMHARVLGGALDLEDERLVRTLVTSDPEQALCKRQGVDWPKRLRPRVFNARHPRNG